MILNYLIKLLIKQTLEPLNPRILDPFILTIQGKDLKE